MKARRHADIGLMYRGFIAAAAAALAALALASGVSASATQDRRCAAGNASTLAVLECTNGPIAASLDQRYQPGAPRFRFGAAPAAIPRCRAAEFLFYAARDWLRLAAKLAERASLCADYFISIPPLVADKTKPRPNQASRLRALGPRFHALAEIHWTAWQRWVGETGHTWYEAGVEARRRMAAAGYDVASGDTWAVNEFPSSVRRNLGTARADARQFVRGLYEGDGRPAEGAVFVIGVRHGTTDASTYKSTLKGWFGDDAFWRDMHGAVRFWGQEVYGDARRWGVPGADSGTRRDYLNDFLQHAARLGSVAPDEEHEAARLFLARAHTPVANAGWQWPTGLGWTILSGDQMRHFVSSQTHALRNFAAKRPGPDRFGFAWAPNNATSMPNAHFVAETGLLLDRLAGALAESDHAWSFEPGISACVALGLDGCRAEVEGAEFTNAWRIFSAWDEVSGVVSRLLDPVVTRVREIARIARGRSPR